MFSKLVPFPEHIIPNLMEIDTKKDGPYTETGGGGVSDAHILIIPDWIYLSTLFSYLDPIL